MESEASKPDEVTSPSSNLNLSSPAHATTFNLNDFIVEINDSTTSAQASKLLARLPRRVPIAQDYSLEVAITVSSAHDPGRFFVFAPYSDTHATNVDPPQIHCFLGWLLHDNKQSDYIVTLQVGPKRESEGVQQESYGQDPQAHGTLYIMLDCLYYAGKWRNLAPEGRYSTLEHQNVSYATLSGVGQPSKALAFSSVSSAGFKIGWAKQVAENCNDQRDPIMQLRDSQETQAAMMDELKKENETLREDIETLRKANSSLETKIETSSQDTSLHIADVLAQRGRLNALESLVHPKLDDLDSSLSTLADRMDKAETAAKSKFSKTQHAVNHNAENFKQLRSNFEEFVIKTNQESEALAEDVNTLGNNLNPIEKTVTSLQDSVSECTSSMNALQTKFATIMSDVEHLLRTSAAQKSLSHLKNEQQSFAAASELRLEKIEHELALQSEGVDARLDNIWDDLNELHGQVDAEADEITMLKEQQETEQDAIDQLQESLDRLEESMEGMATKDSVTELENLQRNRSIISDMRFEEFDSKSRALSDEVNRRFDMTVKNINGVRTKLGTGLSSIGSLRTTQDSQQASIAGLRASINELAPQVVDVQSKVASIKAGAEALLDRFAPAQELEKLQQDFHEQQQWLDAFDKDVTDITAKSIPTMEKDIADISTALEAMSEEKLEDKKVFKQHQDNTESKLEVVDELKKEIVAARQTIAEEKALGRIYAEKQENMEKELEDLIASNYEAVTIKIDSDIATLCFNNSLEPPTVDDFEVHAASSLVNVDKASSTTSDDFEGDGLLDPYGKDTTTRKAHDMDYHYYTSFEAEDRRCAACGYEHGSNGKCAKSVDSHEDAGVDDGEGKDDEVLVEL